MDRRQTGYRGLIAAGLALMALGLLMPSLITVENVGLYDTLHEAIYQEQEVYVLLAAVKLVAVNTVRAYPHYLGVFFLLESFEHLKLPHRIIMSIVTVSVAIPGVYLLIERIHGIHYDFGIPAIAMILILVVMAKVNFSFVGMMKKTVMVAMFITSLQFLDMMPALWRFPFGRGESSLDIKLVSGFLQADSFLQLMSTVFFTLFFFTTVLLFLLILDENNIRRISDQKELNEQMLMQARMRELENRTDMELKYLVHDLKSPLTSMQALVGVVKMSQGEDGARSTVEREYLEKIEASIERMSGMISEILHSTRSSPVTAREMLSGVMAQISGAEYVDLVHPENHAPEAMVRVNKIRFSRALINLVENAAYAVRLPGGDIRLIVEEVEGPGGREVCFRVRDNGSGIRREIQDKIWEKGYSGRDSSGFGLNFVEEVVRQSGGHITLNSETGRGTEFSVFLPRLEEEVEDE